jgi:uncharacterized protein YbbC (DUF1343 family)
MIRFLGISFYLLTFIHVGFAQNEWSNPKTAAWEIDSLHGVMHVKKRTNPPRTVRLGNENIQAIYEACGRAPLAVIANHTSRIPESGGRNAPHLVDTLLSLGMDIRKVFAPEHGFRGDAHNGAHIEDERDPTTGLALISLHGKLRKPTPEMLADVRMLLFDIQDVGARFYTYLSTLFLAMEAAAETGTVLVVLDRPNPHGHQLAGPVMEPQWTSFVGQIPIPILHGMTLGEMAQMINGEGWLANGVTCDLIVIPCEGYAHSDRWFPSIAPSPNLPSDESIALYPSLCLFEATEASIGRGTQHPFECVGFPGMTSGSFSFTPEPIAEAAPYPKHEGVVCNGQSFKELGQHWIEASHGFDLSLVVNYARMWSDVHPDEPFIRSPSSFGRLSGSDDLVETFNRMNKTVIALPDWTSELILFHTKQTPYWIYPLQR